MIPIPVSIACVSKFPDHQQACAVFIDHHLKPTSGENRSLTEISIASIFSGTSKLFLCVQRALIDKRNAAAQALGVCHKVLAA